MWKNLLICAFGVMSLIFGTLTSIEDIINVYNPKDPENFNALNQTVANITSDLVDAIGVAVTTLSP